MEIKFKSWDKNDKKMISWENLIIEKQQNEDFLKLGYKTNKTITTFNHEQILLQYSKEKDKKGKQICVGDIIRLNVETHKPIIKVMNDMYDIFVLSINTERLEREILGNKYENLEILEEYYERKQQFDKQRK